MTEQVVEPTPEKRPPPEYREIVNNDVVKLKREGVENAPDSPKPFFLVASDGFYLNRDTLIGRAFVHQKYYPSSFPKLGGDQFTWKADKIPSEVISKTAHFFRRILKNQKTEAEIILLMNYETREWDIFVPYQLVSYSGVTSAFDPASIPDGWTIVGSIHSHCDFTAFHSGTDTDDAKDMDGVHLTFGHLDEKEFQAVAMVMISGVRWDYEPEEVADFSNLDIDAPEEWDDKVYTYERRKDMPPEVEEIFKKFGKIRDAKVTAITTTTTTYYGTSRPSNLPVQGYHGWYNYEDEWTEEWWTEYRRRMGLDDNYSYGGKEKWKDDDLARKAKLNAPHWEDFLDDKLIDAIIDSPIFTEADLERVTDNPWKAQDIEFWKTLFLQKLAESVNMLNKLGIVVDYRAYPKKAPDEDIDVAKIVSDSQDTEATEDISDYLLPESTDASTERGIEVSGVAFIEGVSLEDRLKEQGFEILEVKDGGSTVVIDVAKV